MVSKQIQPYWYLQQLVDAEVRRLAPDAAVTPVVMYDDEKSNGMRTAQASAECAGMCATFCRRRIHRAWHSSPSSMRQWFAGSNATISALLARR
jgi:hypothetical protein